jgi:hypothetical protein
MISKNILYCGQATVLACDGKCEKAWGLDTRPHVDLDPENPDDFYFLSDAELGQAPDDPGTEEGGHRKPQSPEQKLESKWCARQCERSTLARPGKSIVLPDLSKHLYNIKSHEPDQRK